VTMLFVSSMCYSCQACAIRALAPISSGVKGGRHFFRVARVARGIHFWGSRRQNGRAAHSFQEAIAHHLDIFRGGDHFVVTTWQWTGRLCVSRTTAIRVKHVLFVHLHLFLQASKVADISLDNLFVVTTWQKWTGWLCVSRTTDY